MYIGIFYVTEYIYIYIYIFLAIVQFLSFLSHGNEIHIPEADLLTKGLYVNFRVSIVI
jgi:hypothetical protein